MPGILDEAIDAITGKQTPAAPAQPGQAQPTQPAQPEQKSMFSYSEEWEKQYPKNQS